MKKKHPRNLRFMLAGLLLITLCIAAAFYEWPYKTDALEQINSKQQDGGQRSVNE